MAFDVHTTGDTLSDRAAYLQAQEQAFETKRAAFSQERGDYQKYRHLLQQLHLHYEQERQVCQQEQTYLWEHLHAQRQLRGEDEHPLPVEQQLKQLSEDFSLWLASWHQSLNSVRLAFLERVEALRDQRLLVREQQDPDRRERAFRDLQKEYQQLREELREAKELLREQRESYRQLQLDYQAVLAHLRAEKTVIDQRQETCRWQDYGYSRIVKVPTYESSPQHSYWHTVRGERTS